MYCEEKLLDEEDGGDMHFTPSTSRDREHCKTIYMQYILDMIARTNPPYVH